MRNLKAWQPYSLAQKCFFKLHKTESPGAFSDWDVYWLAGITSLRSLWHVLTEQDSKASPLSYSIINDYKAGPANWEIFQSFVRDQRNRTIKSWNWDIVPLEVSARKWIGDEVLARFTELVFDYSKERGEECSVPKHLQGEDPIRLFGIALSFIYRDLSIIELALKTENPKPFSSHRISETTYSQSPFFDDEPQFYR